MSMLFLFVPIIIFLIFNIFSGGGSARTLRELFYGNYYAEDGIIDNDDKPNSKEAFQKCIDNNIGIKTEVILTKDRKLAVSTFEDLSKEYGAEGKVSEKTEEELKECGVMMLNELLEIVDGQVPVILELKVGDDNEILCRRVADSINAYHHRNVAVASYHTGMIGWFKRKEKAIFRGAISAPAKDFKALPKLDRFLTGNLANNSISRPQFVLYRNKPLPALVKFAFGLGTVRGIWTLRNPEEAKALEKDKEIIICRGFLPEEPHYKDIPVREKSQIEIDAEKKEAARKERIQKKMEYKQQMEAEKKKASHTPSILEECAEDFDDSPIEEYVEEENKTEE